MDNFLIITIFTPIVVFLLLISAFYSFSEIALTSSSKARLKTYKKESKNKRIKKKIEKVILFHENYNESITSIVILNNIINVLATTIATTILTIVIPTAGLGSSVSFISMTVLIIIFGELVPKMLAKKNPEKGLINFYPILYLTKTILKPFTFLLKRLIKEEKQSEIKSVSELKEVIDEISEFNHITLSEQNLLKKALTLNELTAKNKMIILNDIIKINHNSTKKQIIDKIKKYKFTRLPIIKSKTVVGLLNTKTLLIELSSNNSKKNFKTLVEENTFPIQTFNSSTNLSDIFSALRNSRQHMCGIVSSSNKIIGFITIEDIVEIIVGQMYDETEYKKDGIYKLTPTNYHLTSEAKVNDLFVNYLERAFPKGLKKNITISEWFYSKLEKGQSQIIYKNVIIWLKKDKINNEITFEIDVIKNENKN